MISRERAPVFTRRGLSHAPKRRRRQQNQANPPNNTPAAPQLFSPNGAAELKHGFLDASTLTHIPTPPVVGNGDGVDPVEHFHRSSFFIDREKPRNPMYMLFLEQIDGVAAMFAINASSHSVDPSR